MIVTPHDYDTPTYVVCGTQFSGSSLVAGTLRIFDVLMGVEFTHDDTHQDVEFSLLHTQKMRLATIRKRNQEHFAWGFKSVEMRSWLPELLPHLRDPIFLLCSRGLADTLENTNSKYAQGQQTDLVSHLAEEAFWCNFFLANAVPWCVLNYQTEPQALINKILEFTGLDPSEEQVEKALAFNSPRRGYTVI